jgi:hypothetical protein
VFWPNAYHQLAPRTLKVWGALALLLAITAKRGSPGTIGVWVAVAVGLAVAVDVGDAVTV